MPAQAPIVAIASVPRRPLNSALAAWNSSRAMPECEATAPIRMNSGRTESEYAEARSEGVRPSTRNARCQPSSAA